MYQYLSKYIIIKIRSIIILKIKSMLSFFAPQKLKTNLFRLTVFMLVFLFLFASNPGLILAAEQAAAEDGSDTSVCSSEPVNDQPAESEQASADITAEPAEEQEPTTAPEEEVSADMSTTESDEEIPIYNPKEEDTNLKKIEPDQATGALVYSFPIEVPPGRNNLQPSLELTYNSQNFDNFNVFGYGWTISIPSIERVNKKDTEKLYAENFFSSSLSGDLKPVNLFDGTHGQYGAEIETGDFLDYQYQTDNSWLVTDKQGTQYKFGLTADSRQDDPADSAKVFKWMLEEIRDTNNNFVRYEYFKDEGQIYPSKIFYTGHDSQDGIFEIEFSRESRPDNLKSYNTGFLVQTNYRVNQILTKVNGSWVRKYDLIYSDGDNGAKSLLQSIQKIGRDENTSNEILIPANIYNYQKNTGLDFEHQEGWYVPGFNLAGGAPGVKFVLGEVNGDGIKDVIAISPKSTYIPYSNVVEISGLINNGDSTWTYPSAPVLIEGPVGPLSATEFNVADLNGDGLSDIIYTNPEWHIENRVYLNTGSDWEHDPDWSFPVSFRNYDPNIEISFAEVNGDGLIDLVMMATSNLNTDITIRGFVNNGDGTWQPGQGIIMQQDNGNRVGKQLADINGDGLIDVAVGSLLSTDRNKIFINQGDNTWQYDQNYTVPADLNNTNIYSRTELFDINNDNLDDIVMTTVVYKWPTTGMGEVAIRVRLNKGNGQWGSQYIAESIETNYQFISKDYIIYDDLNGDNIIDIFHYIHSDFSNRQVYLNTGNFTDLLSGIENSSGNKINITYQPSAVQNDQYLNPNLPMLLQIVSEIDYDDGLGNIFNNQYQYLDGYYYFENALKRKFAGFNQVIKTDGFGNVSKTYFYQGNDTDAAGGEFQDSYAKIGSVYKKEIYDNADNIYQTQINKWDQHDLAAERYFIKKTDQVVLDYDGNTDHKDKAVSYSYDNTNGNLIQQTEWGQISAQDDGSYSDVFQDKRTTNYEYVQNNLNGLLSKQTLNDYSGTRVSETIYYYDNLGYGQADKGNLTKKEKLEDASANTYINTEKVYNDYGLVIEQKDPRDKSIYYDYDNNYLQPVTVTNSFNQTQSYSYDLSSGQVKQLTDINNNIYQNQYDGLDRLTAEYIPDINNSSQIVIASAYQYDDYSMPRQQIQTVYFNDNIFRDTYSYLDGFGRVIQQREQRADGQYAVKDYQYNQHGLLAKESLPYFSAGQQQTSPSDNNNLYINYVYDPLGRVVQLDNAVGSVVYDYDNWQVKITDPNNNQKDLIKDAYNNLIQVNEYNQGQIYQTKYQYNTKGDLIKITDAENNIREFIYDSLSRRLSATDLHDPADTSFGIWQYEYDSAGNLIRQIDPKQQEIIWTYDDLNRVMAEDFTGQQGIEQTFTYDQGLNGLGQLTQVDSADIISKYQYDALGNLIKETKKITELFKGMNINTVFSYDRQGQLLNLIYPNNVEVAYEYDSTGWLDQVKGRGGLEEPWLPMVTNYDYSPTGSITLQENSNGVTTVNTYDPDELYRLESRLTTNAQGKRLQDLTYTFDNVGNIVQIIDNSETNTAKTANYTYDDLYRLTQADITNTANGHDYTMTYQYNSIGNIMYKSDQGNYQYNGNQGTSFTNPHAVTRIDELDLDLNYDANGNLAEQVFADKTINYLYDYNNNLISSDGGDSLPAVYQYDYSGQRIAQKIGSEDQYTYYPNKYINISRQDNQWKVTMHAYANDKLLLTAEDIEGMIEVYFDHTDHLGSSGVITDQAGQTVQVLDYYPFGNTRLNEQSADFDEQRKYTGHEFDANTGLYYMNARYYSGDLGRFASLDPVFLTLGDNKKFEQIISANIENYLSNPQYLNSYSYALNNPFNYVDPSGESPWSTFGVGLFQAVKAVTNVVSSVGQAVLSGVSFAAGAPQVSAVFAVGAVGNYDSAIVDATNSVNNIVGAFRGKEEPSKLIDKGPYKSIVEEVAGDTEVFDKVTTAADVCSLTVKKVPEYVSKSTQATKIYQNARSAGVGFASFKYLSNKTAKIMYEVSDNFTKIVNRGNGILDYIENKFIQSSK